MRSPQALSQLCLPKLFGRRTIVILLILLCLCIRAESTFGEPHNASKTITVEKGDHNGNVYGFQDNKSGDVFGYTINMYDLTTVNGNLVSGESSGCAVTNNTVNMYGGTVTNIVCGGSSMYSTAASNAVNMYGGTVACDVIGGNSMYSTAASNAVNIHGGTVNNSVFGGKSSGYDVTNNAVNIYGGTVTKNVFGGESASWAVTNNMVNIYGNPKFSKYTWLYGGMSYAGNARSGNTLNLYTSGITVGNIANFDNLNFYLPETIRKGSTVLTLKDIGDTDISNAVLGVGVQGGGTPLQTGDTVTLIQKDSGNLITSGMTQKSLAGQQGISLLYDFAISRVENDLIATATYKGVHKQTQSLQSGQAAALALSLQGADLSAGAGISNALAATGGLGALGGSAASSGGVQVGSAASTGGAQAGNAVSPNGMASSHDVQAGGTAPFSGVQASGLGGSADGSWGIVPFYAVSGGFLRYDAGTDIDVTGYSMLAGMAKSLPLGSVHLLLGAFFETGGARYHSSNEYSGAASVDGKGNSRYFGGGLLARRDVTEGLLRGLYVEGSARAGTLTASYESSDLKDATGRTADYDVQSPYQSLHFGLGYLWRVNDSLTLDVSSKYFYSHIAGDSVRVIEDPVEFEDTHSYRWRNGLRLTYAASETFAPYAGVAYEHEYGGESRAAVYGREMPSASVEGGTGIGELGFTLRPVADSTFAVDLGLQGYTGKRQGVTGGLQLGWEF